MRARVQCRLEVNFLSNKAKLHKIILDTPKLRKYIPETIIIKSTAMDPNNKDIGFELVEPWIWRPEFGCSGWGIEVVTSNEELEDVIDRRAGSGFDKYRFLLSKYITDPRLITNPADGLEYKFHIRVWAIAIVDADDRHRFLLLKTGNLITSGSPYTNSDFNNKEIHDTHQSKSFQVSEGSFPHDYPGTEVEKSELVEKIKLMLTDIFSEVSTKITKIPHCESGFQIFGIDIMITNDGDPMLLEINNQPGLPGYHKYNPNYVSRLSKEFYSGLWDMVFQPLVMGKSIPTEHPHMYKL